jgi:GH24 family phage-related lysozyme (muramidase)
MNFGKTGFAKLMKSGNSSNCATELQRFRYELNNRKQSVIRSILRQFIKPQDYSDYTINQVVWRYVMRKNVDYLSKVA